VSGARIRTQRRRQRMLRKKSKREVVALNLVSMIDIFTTLVFFLLIATTNVVTLRNPNSLTLPSSISMEPPRDTPVLEVTKTRILLQGKPVMDLAVANKEGGTYYPELAAQLEQVPMQKLEGGATATTRGEINIMADRDTPYAVLKKVMATAGQERFARISLSVNHAGHHT
jgi:biopolymer transport protein ExbD